MATIIEKYCPGCETIKPAAEFYMRYSKRENPVERLTDLSSYCKECQRFLQLTKWRTGEGAKEKQYAAYIKTQYGMTIVDYDCWLDSQNGGCRTCGTKDPGRGCERFCIDHDHACCPNKKSCGECVRGLLCNHCNSGLGEFKDDPAIMINAISYLINDPAAYITFLEKALDVARFCALIPSSSD